MPIQNIFNKAYKSKPELFTGSRFLDLMNKISVLGYFPQNVTNNNVNINYKDKVLSGTLQQAIAEVQFIDGNAIFNAAGGSFSVNQNPTKSLSINLNTQNQTVNISCNNFSPSEPDAIYQLLTDTFPFVEEIIPNQNFTMGGLQPFLSEDFKAFLSRRQNNSKEVFIIMSFNEEHRDAYFVSIEPTLKKLGFKSIRVDQIQHNNTVTKEIYEAIERAAFVIADLTGERPNVYYEVGWAHKAGKEVVLLAKKGTSVHFDVAAINRIDYKDFTDLSESLEKRVKSVSDRLGIDIERS